MANYTFTTKHTYDLANHDVSFTSTVMTVTLTATGTKVFTQDFDKDPVAFMCQGDKLNIGELKDNGVFANIITFNKNPKAKIWFDEKPSANRVIGSDDHGDPSIAHQYNVNQCPVRLVGTKGDVKMECPCEDPNGKCTNKCYTYGN